MATENTGLEVDIGVTLNKLTRQLAQAEARMAKTAQRAEQGFTRSNRKVAKSFENVTRSTQRLTGGNGLRMVSLQLSQVGQQGAVTGDYLRALSIQMPDLLLAFGTFGALLGTAVGVMTPMIQGMFSATEQSKLLEAQVDGVAKAVNAYISSAQAAVLPTAELEEKYQDLADVARDALRAISEFDLREAVKGLEGGIDAITSEFEGVLDLVEELRVAQRNLADARQNPLLDTTGDEAALMEALGNLTSFARTWDMSVNSLISFSNELRSLQSSGSTEELVRQANDLNEALIDAYGSTVEMPDEIAEIAKQLAIVVERGAAFLGTVSSTADETARLGDEAQRAAAALQQTFERESKVYSGRGSDPRRFGNGYSGQDVAPPRRTTGTSSRGGSRGVSTAEREAARVFSETRTEAERYRTELERLAELKEASLITTETYSRAVNALQENFTGAAERAADFESRMQSITSSFVDAILAGESFGSTMSRILSDLGSQLISSGVSSIVGSALGGLGLSGIIPGFATGTNFAPGGLAVVGERGPELINLPRGSKVYDAASTRSMVSGGGGTEINISIDAKGADASVEARIDAALTRALPEIQRVAVAGVVGARRRGYPV